VFKLFAESVFPGVFIFRFRCLWLASLLARACFGSSAKERGRYKCNLSIHRQRWRDGELKTGLAGFNVGVVWDDFDLLHALYLWIPMCIDGIWMDMVWLEKGKWI